MALYVVASTSAASVRRLAPPSLEAAVASSLAARRLHATRAPPSRRVLRVSGAVGSRRRVTCESPSWALDNVSARATCRGTRARRLVQVRRARAVSAVDVWYRDLPQKQRADGARRKWAHASDVPRTLPQLARRPAAARRAAGRRVLAGAAVQPAARHVGSATTRSAMADRCPGFLQWPSSLSALRGRPGRRLGPAALEAAGLLVERHLRPHRQQARPRARPRPHGPAGIVCDSASDEFEDATCYVADRNNHRIQHLRLRDAQVAPSPRAARPRARTADRTAAPPPPSRYPRACVRRCSAASARTAPARVS